MSRIKLAIVSHVLPPSWSGQAMVLSRILDGIDPDRYCLISNADYGATNHAFQAGKKLPAKYFHLPPETQLPTGQRFGIGRVTAALNPWIRTLQRARRISRILRTQGCNVVVACTGGIIDPPAAYAASRLVDIPFYMHAFDDYWYQWANPQLRAFARRTERIIAKNAAGIIVPNEFMGGAYSQRYDVSTFLVRNPSHPTIDSDDPKISWPAYDGEIRIVYTGAVYQANYDAFRNLILALGRLKRPDVSVHIYTAQSPKELERKEIRGPVVFHDHVAPSRIRSIQREADILFLPLAFESPIQEVVRTSAPGKMGEYLASGRPILVHAPADSFVSWFIKKNSCGIVVDENRPEALLEGIRTIIDDQGLRDRLVEKARSAAMKEFDPLAVRAVYWDLIDSHQEG